MQYIVHVVNPNMWMLTFNVILGYQGLLFRRVLAIFFLRIQFFFNPTDPISGNGKGGMAWKANCGDKTPDCIFKVSFPYKDRLRTRAQLSRVVYKANCWDCQDFYIGKTKRSGLHYRKTELFKAITSSNHQLLYPANRVSFDLYLGKIEATLLAGYSYWRPCAVNWS